MINNPEKIYLNDHVEVAAFAVCLNGMGHGKSIQEIGSDDHGWYVSVIKPIPPDTKEGIIRAIRKDQQTNPKKWEDTRNKK